MLITMTPARRSQKNPFTAASVLLSCVWLLCSSVAFASAGSGGDGFPFAAIELPSLSASAETHTVFEDDAPQLRARLLVSSAPERRVGVLFDLEPGWHVYWQNPGGTGLPPELGLASTHHEVGAVAWPAPQTFEEADGLFTTWGYEGSVLLSAPLSPNPAAADPATTDDEVTAHARVLICRTQCVPAEFSLSSKIEGAASPADQAQIDSTFQHALARVPIQADQAGLQAKAEWNSAEPAEDETGLIKLSLETCPPGGAPCADLAEVDGSALFVPFASERFELEESRVLDAKRDVGRFVLGLELTRLDAGTERLRGLVPIRNREGQLQHVEIDVEVEQPQNAGLAAAAAHSAAGAPTAETAGAAVPAVSTARWIQIFFLAMLGGLILNGMPCVLPVLAIKIVAIADMAEKDPREVRMHGVAYTAGVMGSMAVLAAVVLAMRSAGHSVGWGFQFQEPIFVAVISAVLVTFALNLFGVFEIELGQGRLATIGQEATGLRRSVFEGLLAVVLATPCTAPFLGTAVGFAFASDGMGIPLIFLAIGAGLASPFLVVSFAPSLARFIPRSGPWMNTLRAGLGFSLLATVVWLLWVLGQSGGTEAVVSMTGVLLFLGFLLWVFGQFQPFRSQWLGRVGVLAVATIVFAGFNLIEFDPTSSASGETSTGSHAEGWQIYSASAVAESLAAGRPAFVVFTADWCITCKVNERTVIERETVQQALSERGFALFKADWTRRDDGIRTKLAEFGRAGVPLYLVYHPDRPSEPQVLSELLSQNEVLTALALDTSPVL